MDFDQFVSEYIAEDHDFEQLSVMVLEGCRAWYPLAAEAEKQKLQEVMEKAARAVADAHRGSLKTGKKPVVVAFPIA